MPTVYLEYQGQPVPASDLVWYTIAPCGCTTGVMTTDAGKDGATLTTPEQAEQEWQPRKPPRERDRRAGYRQELGLRADVTTRLGNDCPHTPRLGVEATPKPDGHHWALGYKGRKVHLVPGEPVRHRIQAPSYHDTDRITALCSAAEYSWDTWPGNHHDYLECPKCAKAARDLDRVLTAANELA